MTHYLKCFIQNGNPGEDLQAIANIRIQRCFKPQEFGRVVTTELHHLSDASTTGYGQCSYLRLVDEDGHIHCSLVMAKASVAPKKIVTMPRLKLTAALISVKVSNLLQQQLDYENLEEKFWSDSKVVLGYINNEARRFHVFVANRVQQTMHPEACVQKI